MSENTFFQVSRNITRHPVFLSSSHVYRCILISILDHIAFEKTILYDHGNEVILQAGQLMATDRQIASWNGCKHYEVQRALACFEVVSILRQEVRHRKRIITILDPYICKAREKSNAPKIAPKLRQDCAIKEQLNNLITKKTTTTPKPSSSKTTVVDFVAAAAFYECLKNGKFTEEEKKTLMAYPEERVQKALDWSKENPPKKTLMSSLVWHCKQAVPPEPKGKNKEINLKICKNYFKTHLKQIPGLFFHPAQGGDIFVVGPSEDIKNEISTHENPHIFVQQLLGAMRKFEFPVHEDDLVSN